MKKTTRNRIVLGAQDIGWQADFGENEKRMYIRHNSPREVIEFLDGISRNLIDFHLITVEDEGSEKLYTIDDDRVRTKRESIKWRTYIKNLFSQSKNVLITSTYSTPDVDIKRDTVFGMNLGIMHTMRTSLKDFGSIARIPIVGKDIEDGYLDNFDTIIVSFMPFAWWGGYRIFSVLATMQWAENNNKKLIVSLEDYRFDDVYKAFKKFAEDPDLLIALGTRLSKSKAWEKETRWARNNKDMWVPMLKRMASDDEWPTTIACMYDSGDVSKLASRIGATEEMIITADPSIACVSYYSDFIDEANGTPTMKSNRWSMASLQAHTRWMSKLKNGWSIDEFCAKKGVGLDRIPEWELIKMYANNWGAIAPTYSQADIGWWRNRYPLVASVESIHWTDDVESAFLPKSFQNEMSFIEGLNETSLKDLAEQQKRDYWKLAWTQERWERFIKDVIL